MTAEVYIANRYALVLAADSASTVSDGPAKERYYKGANKIFQLSNHQPVGVMIHASGALQGLPWETIVKACRADLGDQEFDTLDLYANFLETFIKTKLTEVFTSARREQHFTQLVATQVNLLRSHLLGLDAVKSAPQVEDVKRELTTELAAIEANMMARPLPSQFAPTDEAESLAAVSPSLKPIFHGMDLEHPLAAGATWGEAVDIDKMLFIANRMVFLRVDDILPSTGVVVAGFGKQEFFPRYIHLEYRGFLRDLFCCRTVKDEQLSPDDVSAIIPFAQTAMSETFLFGVSPEVLRFVDEATSTCIDNVANALLGAGGVLPGNWDAQKADLAEKHKEAWAKKAIDAHWSPLSKIVASLPVPDLATLAETLVALTSLKERVTVGTETVGGAVDVASITKGDGFIWIKRKHYFDPALNPRYFSALPLRR